MVSGACGDPGRVWTRLRARLPAGDLAETAAVLLDALGSTGLIEEDRPGRQVEVTAFFEGDRREVVAAAFRRRWRDLSWTRGRDAPPLDVDLVPIDEWATAWQAHFRPLHVAGPLWIAPPWRRDECPAGSLMVMIDPGMAFGTGDHPTTRACLEYLVEQGERLAGSSLLDVGCGSGILGIAAARLGAHPVLAVDWDPEAIAATRHNLDLNGLARALSPVLGSASCAAPGTWDLVVANMTLGRLVPLLPDLRDALAPGGRLVLSGLLEDQRQIFGAHLADAGLDTVALDRAPGASGPAGRDRWLRWVCRLAAP